MMTGWETLVRRYADGREICNCGNAYYTNCGKGIGPLPDGGWGERSDLPACAYGCSANQIATRNEIGRRVVEELSLTLETA